MLMPILQEKEDKLRFMQSEKDLLEQRAKELRKNPDIYNAVVTEVDGEPHIIVKQYGPVGTMAAFDLTEYEREEQSPKR